jgi:2-haloacid dehalogenase
MAVFVFDVNETLLDLRALDGPVFGGDSSLRERWFSQVLQLAFLTTILGEHRPFGELGAAALRMVAPGASAEALSEGMATLPAHADVAPALAALREGGHVLAALSQNLPDVLERQLTGAGLRACFAEVVSAHDSGRFKPAAPPYELAAERLGHAPSELTMVAAHAWDCAGAAAVGMSTVLVARPGSGVVADPSQVRPDRVVADLRELTA